MPEELETHQEGKKKPKTPMTFWKELTLLEWGAVLVPIFFLIYLDYSTALIPNYNNGNETRVINGIPNPPNTIIYPPNSFVPQSNVSNSQTAFGSIIYLICILILLQKRLREPKRATPKEAMDDLSKQIHQLRDLPLADGTTIPITDDTKIYIHPHFLTRYKSTGDIRKAFRYVFQVIVENKLEESTHYYRAWYHPWDWYWDGFFPAKTLLGDKDYCSTCGNEYDEKVILADKLKEFRELRRGLGGRF